jgi:hypothetical protein
LRKKYDLAKEEEASGQTKERYTYSQKDEKDWRGQSSQRNYDSKWASDKQNEWKEYFEQQT